MSGSLNQPRTDRPFSELEIRTVLSLNRHKRSVALAAPLLVASTLLAAGSAQAAGTAQPKLVLVAYKNGVGGESLVAGRYDEALEALLKSRPQTQMAASAKAMNLCVAYAVTHQLTQARTACEVALRMAKSDKISSSRYSPGGALENSYIAMAYSNRAVVRMLSKDAENAQVDLKRAQSLAPSAGFVTQNVAATSAPHSKIAQVEITPSR
jgi:tetratricopeptide (TPR) repeat protein